jgi:CubicO group peptidase (beta-lactamase class C family)
MVKDMRNVYHFLLYAILLLGVFSECLAEKQSRKNDGKATFSTSLDKEFYRLCEEEKFLGVMLVAKQDTILFEKSCGLSSRSFNVKNNLSTKFNLASVGKVFTSIAIAQLVQQKILTLDMPIYKIIPDWLPNDKTSKNITVQQLLTHTSGLTNYMDDLRWKLGADSALYVNLEDYKPLIKDEKILFRPGTSQFYSNSGYILLGAIIEKVTHMKYEDYIQRYIFIPAGMKNTGNYRLDTEIPNRAVGYTHLCTDKKCVCRNNYFEAEFMGNSAGGAYSTAHDLFLLSKSLHHNKLIDKKHVQYFFSANSVLPHAPGLTVKPMKIGNEDIPETFSTYGFAGVWNTFGLAIWRDSNLIGHTGETAGASAFFATSPYNAVTIIILSNLDGAEGTLQLYKKARSLLGYSEYIENY